MAHQPYYNSRPGWGTSQFQFGAPPAPNFQPQASWSGYDYYRAHAGASPDPSLYDRSWGRVREQRDFSGAGGLGVGINEAKIWHHRAYGGLVDIQTLAPPEIGHAAAYEAFRTWVHNASMYQPLSGDIDRQREALVGLAIAETSRLMAFANRHGDNYGRMEASDAAAATASILFYWSHDREERMDMEYEYERGRGRRPSYAGSADSFEDPYASDTRVMYGRGRGRSRSRGPYVEHRPGMPMPAAGGMPMPVNMGSFHGGGSNSGSYHGGGHAGSYQGGGGFPSSYSPSDTAFPTSNNAPVLPMGMPRTRHSSMSYPTMNSFHGGSGVGYSTGAPDPYGGPEPFHGGGYPSSGQYAAPSYISSAGATYGNSPIPGGYPGQAPITVVMTQPSSRSHHSSGHGHHHHSSSKHKHGKSKKHRSQSRHRSRSRHRA